LKPPPRFSDLPPPSPALRGWTSLPSSPPPRPAGPLPRLSLVTPSFNQAAYLEETIRSVLLQGYPDLQYIVIDGGSTDGSVEIIRKYAPWLDYWESQPDRGQSHAINKGLVRCDGTWFNWLCSDDYLLPGALAALAATGAEVPDAKIVAGVTENLRAETVFGCYAARVERSAPEVFFSLGINQPGSLVDLAAVRRLGGVREDLHLTMDLDLWLRLLARHGAVAFADTPRPVARYRYHAASKTCSAAEVFALDEFALLFDLARQCGVVPPPPVAALRRLSTLPESSFPFATPPDPSAAAVAWLRRLVVTDTLLFRALLRARADQRAIGSEFIALLDSLRPAVARHFPGRDREIEGRALILAQQSLGRLDGKMTRRALRRAPGVGTALETLRLAARRLRQDSA